MHPETNGGHAILMVGETKDLMDHQVVSTNMTVVISYSDRQGKGN
jgi:hypothetical protein